MTEYQTSMTIGKRGIIALLCAISIMVAWRVYWHVEQDEHESGKSIPIRAFFGLKNSDDIAPATATSTQTVENPIKTAKRFESYVKAKQTFVNRLEFTSCVATPRILTVEKSGWIMLDNRDALIHHVTLQDRVYSVVPYDYIVVAAPSVAGMYHVLCDQGNGGQLVVK